MLFHRSVNQSFRYQSSIPLYGYTTIYLSVLLLMDFWVVSGWVTMCKNAINILIWVFFVDIYFHFFWVRGRLWLRARLADSETAKQVSKVVVPFYSPTSNVREFCLVCELFHFSSSSWCQVVSHWLASWNLMDLFSTVSCLYLFFFFSMCVGSPTQFGVLWRQRRCLMYFP